MKRMREDVLINRPVTVERIPDGTPMDLPGGLWAQVTQALGSNFTLVVEGQLVRLKGSDADAIGKEPPAEVEHPENVEIDDVSGLIWNTLKTCYDPEIPVNIVDLGLVYRCDLEPMEGGDVRALIDMTLTAPGCGMGEAIADEVCDKVLAIPRVGEITVNMVFDPPWDRSRMSEAAMLAMGM
ncbi:MAG: putative Fe-S cluster assembly protein SufT [Giesbergeria sp.]|nr:putative Fe-S cluster assembly protein SufT [Giesbergeria sp.]MBP6159228.1 putative Fe-S cluster assembly protein SufT [Giesbergeria sp.]MBP7083330.1 putative Fe-S cluster assembly protein SufT [Giesbergeria sp.]MBP9783633.1 putative Fe-S cluster assembly protein SufT [Giesbergeria sp.]MBP9894246.1 putative Fe-S cluster assembly protein SufT [Giesbergeria sp.]